ncbi:hypothetical protein ARMSODRAFT_366805 [Armillaria solidipes]|uniref:Uncharacterized protein n=1 Tax=Armillaria solidipes TaxID=1076256 RepID=A0A2H3BG65_9AGAR|nr:hypothetical protein ARMSODRAFT_366805 [Armillaria solidipes]
MDFHVLVRICILYIPRYWRKVIYRVFTKASVSLKDTLVIHISTKPYKSYTHSLPESSTGPWLIPCTTIPLWRTGNRTLGKTPEQRSRLE